MKKIIIIGLWALFPGLSLVAQNTEEQSVLQDKVHEWKVSGQLGLQAGGAIPIPMSALSGDDGAVHAQVKVYPRLAARVGKRLSDHWWAYVGLNYASSGITAKARVKNQRIKEIDRGSGELMVKYFTGVSHVEMAFAYAEFPVYAEYSISSRNKLIMGLYGAYKVGGKFETTAVKGFTSDKPDNVHAEVRPSDNIRSNFSVDLRSWDFGVLLGYEFAVFSRLNAGLHLNFSPFDVFKAEVDYFDYTMHPLRGAIMVSYDLFRR
ncbi:MAG: PorT family protein [Prevotellaceae bacterium]|nr:PorT family protein [Prevotellaceae bacterium]